jgi:hypothetical protein
MSMRKQILQSLKSHAVGHINKHKMNVEIYLENPVGIGEHPDVMEAIEQELEMISKYHEQIEVIEKYLEEK